MVKLASVPRYDPPEIEPLTVEEAQAIVRAVAGRRNGVRWLIGLALGGLVAAPTKTRSSRRMLVLPQPLVVALAEHRRAQAERQEAVAELWVDGDWIFTTDIGSPVDARNDLRDWKQVVKAAGVRQVRIHDLRHTSATLQLVAGTDSRTLQGLFGWSSPVLVARYAHVIEQAKRDAAHRIGDVLWAKISYAPPGSQI